MDDSTMAHVQPTRKKLSKRKKIRRLAEEKTDIITSKSALLTYYLKRLLLGSLAVAVAIAVLMGHNYTQKHSSKNNLLKEFIKSYSKHYNQIVHGQPDYCDHLLDTQALFAAIRQGGILHQDQAIKQLELVLRNQSNLNAIALTGPSGVGKSMLARTLRENFPWRENVQSYVWNTYVPKESDKYDIVYKLIENFSDCGSNLLIIDNLPPSDRNVVATINNLIGGLDNAVNKHVVVLYIFNLNSMDDRDVYEQQYELLQSLPATRTINFKQFGTTELKDCIQREVSAENLHLNAVNFAEILATIRVKESGCKNVYAKVVLYGQK